MALPRALAMWLASACLGVVLAAGAAQGGPWPRDPGAAFLSTKLGAERADGRRVAFAEVYGEAGWRPGLVVAGRLRLDGPLGAEGRGDGLADLRLRWHPAQTGALALGLEGGLILDSGARRPGGATGSGGFGLAAVHLGRGMATPLGPGWLRLSLTHEAPVTTGALARAEVSGQVGLRADRGWLALTTLGVFRQGGETTVTLRQGVGRSLGTGRDLLLEGVLERGGSGRRGLSLALWQAF